MVNYSYCLKILWCILLLIMKLTIIELISNVIISWCVTWKTSFVKVWEGLTKHKWAKLMIALLKRSQRSFQASWLTWKYLGLQTFSVFSSNQMIILGIWIWSFILFLFLRLLNERCFIIIVFKWTHIFFLIFNLSLCLTVFSSKIDYLLYVFINIPLFFVFPHLFHTLMIVKPGKTECY